MTVNDQSSHYECVINKTLAMCLYYLVQLTHLFITILPYSAVGIGRSNELSIPMSRPSKNKESRNRCKSWPFKKRALVQWDKHVTNAYIGHQFEPRSRFASRATRLRRISVRSTVSAHCSHQRTHTTHHTATTRLRIASAKTGRHHRSTAAGNLLLRNKYIEHAGSGDNATHNTGPAAFTTHGNISSRQTTPAANLDDRRACLWFLVACARVLGA
ncbi:MAG: hypothetical protein EZS28_000227 [Streblomastix strix]|uniref:Uncharacterized protein n=1 Tax=Streblomastix strix TaxID=222440 RepID=A0A5J4XAU1_9EUKA|nr:MAG: hypothetical protein EZS28_000227 [Streblomastix strix]